MAALAVLAPVAGLGLPVDPLAASPTPDGPDSRSSASVPGACTTPVGVTVIIDFQELGGGSYVRCAPRSPRSGFEALEQAGISYTAVTSSPGFLCRIAGKPANDPCRVASPSTAYWSYWVAPRGGYWCYANFGAGNRTPPPGTVEGWSFALDQPAANTPPPGIAPPAPLGPNPPQLPARDCTAPTEGSTTTTTVKPSTTRPATVPTPNPSSPSGPAGPAVPGPRPGGSNGGPVAPDGPVVAPRGSDGTPTTTGSSGTNTTTAPTDGSTSTSPDGTASSGATSTSDAKPPVGVEGSGDRGITDPGEIAALEGDVDLGDDGRSTGSPVPLMAAGVVAAGLVAGGARQRRRRQAGSDPT